jgi:hypothetical protein
MQIEVLDSLWGADGEEYAGGVHEIAKPTAKFLRLAAAAEAVGAIRVKASAEERARMRSHVESQADSEKARAKAQESGAWYEANMRQFLHDVETGSRDTFGADVGPEQYVEDRKGVTDG